MTCWIALRMLVLVLFFFILISQVAIPMFTRLPFFWILKNGRHRRDMSLADEMEMELDDRSALQTRINILAKRESQLNENQRRK